MTNWVDHGLTITGPEEELKRIRQLLRREPQFNTDPPREVRPDWLAKFKAGELS